MNMAAINGVWFDSAVKGAMLWHLIRYAKWLPLLVAGVLFVIFWAVGVLVLQQSALGRADFQRLTVHVAAARAAAAFENRMLQALSITQAADAWLDAKGSLHDFNLAARLTDNYPGVVGLRMLPPGSKFDTRELLVRKGAPGDNDTHVLVVVPAQSRLRAAGDGASEQNWVVELDLATLASAADIANRLRACRYEVSFLDRQRGLSELLLSSPGGERQMVVPETVVVDVLNYQLALKAEPLNGWGQGLASWSTMGAGVVAAFLALVVYHLVRQQQFTSLNALRDPLTGLPNRRLFEERAQLALALAQREKTNVAVLFLDLDGFKTVNDHYGHSAGDALLAAITVGLSKQIRRVDTLARVGGDEFVVLLVNLPAPSYAQAVANKLIRCATQPVEVDGHVVAVGASVGISIYPDDASDLNSLLRLSDEAMYRAKRAGGRSYARAGAALAHR